MDNYYQPKIVDNIKHEPERHFVFIMPDDPEPEIEEITEVRVILRKFDKKWKTIKPKLFGSYFVCGKCDHATKESSNLKQHLKVCKILQKCESCGLTRKSEKIKECDFCDLKFDCDKCKQNHHERDHCKGSIWECIKCDYKSSVKSSLRIHYKSHVKKISCETCKRNFAFNNQLVRHQQQHRHGSFSTDQEIKFECKTCIRSFATKNGLTTHEKRVHSKQKFHCDICGQIFKTKLHLRQHMPTHIKVFCPICDQLVAGSRIKDHIARHSQAPKFKCDVCDKVFFSKINLMDHKRIHKIDEVQCDLCSKMFQNKGLLREHVKNHLKIPCPMCKKQMTKSNLIGHLKTVHSTEQFHPQDLQKCSKCDYQTFNKTCFKNHYQTHVKKFSCETCKRKFALIHSLKNHQQQHRHGVFAAEPEIKYECKTCIRSFGTKCGLTAHERGVHSKQKFHCDICGQIFKCKALLHQHMHTHLKISCPICQHMIAGIRLKEHIESHSSTAKFKCDTCEKAFFSKKNLNCHKERNHKIVKVQCDLCAKIFRNKISLKSHMEYHIKIQCSLCKRKICKSSFNRHLKKVHSSRKLVCDITKCLQRFENIEELKAHKKIHIGPKSYKCTNCNHKVETLRKLKLHMESTHKM